MNILWKLAAKILSRPAVANWLIERAKKTPYSHIYKDAEKKSSYAETPDVYMERYWVFNPYQRGEHGQERSKYSWFPWNIRIHWIRRPDQDKHMHDHPWNARTIILRGGYVEERHCDSLTLTDGSACKVSKAFTRRAGDTAKIGYGMYHRITHLQAGGAWTLFISGPYQGTWGFLVDGVKVHWCKYLGLEK